jgi:hypothetical protein
MTLLLNLPQFSTILTISYSNRIVQHYDIASSYYDSKAYVRNYIKKSTTSNNLERNTIELRT